MPLFRRPKTDDATRADTSRGDPPSGESGLGTGNGLYAIVGGILNALNEAQRMSADTAIDWGREALHSPSGIPNHPTGIAMIDRLELDLRYALCEPSTTTTTVNTLEIDQTRLMSISADVAHSVLQEVADHLSSASGPNGLTDVERQIVANLRTQPIGSWLAAIITKELQSAAPDLVTHEGDVDTGLASLRVGTAVSKQLTAHPDLTDLIDRYPLPAEPFAPSRFAPLKQDVIRRVQTDVSKVEMGVIVDAERLAKLPPSSVQTLKLSLKMRELEWRLLEDGQPVIVMEDS